MQSNFQNNIQKNTPGVPAKNNAYLPKIDAGEYLEAENLTDLIRVVREHKVLSNLSEDFEINLLEQVMIFLRQKLLMI